jgi:hypothetical protein
MWSAPDGYRELGAETIRPILTRGVLLDVAGWKGVDRLPQHYAITADDLDGCARAAEDRGQRRRRAAGAYGLRHLLDR